MAKQDFVSGKQADRLNSGREFIKQLKVDGTTFGIVAADITAAEGKFNDFENNFKTGITLDGQKQQQTKITNGKDSDFETVWRAIAGTIKKNKNYSEAIGQRYKIVGNEKTVDIANSKPALNARKVATGWELSFSLLGFFDGVKIFRKRPAQTQYQFIAVDTSSPYIDSEPQENGTEYYCFFLIGDEQVGLQSDIVKITV